MSGYQQKPGDIVAYKETDKKNDRSPDWKGSMIVPEGAKPGDKLEVAFWAKGDRGTMLAGSVKFPNQRNAGPGGDQRYSEGVARSQSFDDPRTTSSGMAFGSRDDSSPF